MDRQAQRIKTKLYNELERLKRRARKAIHSKMDRELRKWRKQFPEKEILFSDCLSIAMIWVNDRAVYVGQKRSDCKDVQPLCDLIEWYCEVSEALDVAIEDIVLPPLKVTKL